MKILDITSIGASNAMPIKSGTLQFLQDAHKETIAGLITNILPNPISTTVYIISGCVNSGTGNNYNISAGIIYYNGEIFNFDGKIFTLTGLQKAYARIETTQYITNADPVQFTDGIGRNVHNIRKFVIENTITSSGLPEYKDFVFVPSSSLRGDTKEIVCDSAYLATNFDASGLGRFERTGWAIMNGNNTTPNDNGKVVIAYGSSYTTLGATGGSENAVLIGHNHVNATTGKNGLRAQGSINLSTASSGFYLPTEETNPNYGMDENGTRNDTQTGTGKNMQPYVVRLRIMKL